jgi:hypothetical protein
MAVIVTTMISIGRPSAMPNRLERFANARRAVVDGNHEMTPSITSPLPFRHALLELRATTSAP